MRVAVCFSGQTRSFEKHKDTILNDLSRLFNKHEIDLFGHTWSDCPAPSDLSIFSRFEQTDQDEISEWVKEDITTFGTFYDWNDISEYQNILNGNGDYLEFICARSKGRLGQTVSAYKAFQLVPANQYDIIVRYRWDNCMTTNEYMYGEHRAIDDFHISLEKFMETGYDIALPIGVRYCYGDVGRITSPDLFFVMTKQRHSYIIERDIKKIHRAINSINLASHSLWSEVLSHYVYEQHPPMGKVVSMLPSLWEPYGDSSPSENKKWKL